MIVRSRYTSTRKQCTFRRVSGISIRVSNIVGLFYAVMFFVTAGPIVMYYSVGSYFYALAYGGLLSALLLLVVYRGVPKRPATASLVVALLFVYLYVPFREYDVSNYQIINGLLVALALSLPRVVQDIAIAHLRMLLCILSIPVLLLFPLLLMGVDIPWFALSQDFRSNAADYYRVYPGMVVLSTQVYEFGPGIIFRASALFREPGHFAIVTSVLLMTDRMDLTKPSNRIIALAGMLSFSLIFYIIAVIGWVVFRFRRPINASKSVAVWAFVATLIVTGVWSTVAYRIDIPVAERLIFTHFDESRGDNVFDRRSVRFGGLNDHLFGVEDYLIGRGSSYMGSVGISDSGLRGFVVLHGITGILLILALIFALVRRASTSLVAVSVSVVLLLIILHRSWMITQPWLLVASFYITGVDPRGASSAAKLPRPE